MGALMELDIRFKKYDELALLSDLKTSPHQRNKHPQEQIERLAKLMNRTGIRHPIHISRRSGTICFGHGRRDAALLNGYEKFPIVYQDFDSDEEEYACVQSDNAIAAWSELDHLKIEEDILNFSKDFDTDLLGIKAFSGEIPKFESELLDSNSEPSQGGITKVIIHLTDEQHLEIMQKVQKCCEKSSIFDLTSFFIAAVNCFDRELNGESV